MRRFHSVNLVICVALICAPLALARPASNGSVSRSWISIKNGGSKVDRFASKKAPKLYANFVLRTAPTANRDLKIIWRDPKGQLQAEWDSTTRKDDRKGTRLFAYINPKVYRAVKGRWTAKLLVAGKPISQATIILT